METDASSTLPKSFPFINEFDQLIVQRVESESVPAVLCVNCVANLAMFINSVI